jgi:hypothetical protein
MLVEKMQNTSLILGTDGFHLHKKLYSFSSQSVEVILNEILNHKDIKMVG